MAERTSIGQADPGRDGPLRAALGLASVRRPDLRQRGSLFAAAIAARLAGAGLLAWIGYIHWYLWHEGYRQIPTDGPFFLLDAIAGVALAVAMLAWARPLTGLVAAAFAASTIAALLISLTVGLFGFTESIHASYVVQALVLESAALIVLVAWTVLAARSVPRRG